ncbi:MAG: cardiolipin synthase [Solirubrobacterales bacterium]
MKYFIKIIFSRVTYIIVALLVQLIILVGVVFRFRADFLLFYGLSMFLGILAVLWIINQNSNPSYKIAWITLIFALPIFGVLFYAFYEQSKLNRKTMYKMKTTIDKMRQVLPSNQGIIEALDHRDKHAGNQCRYISNYAAAPLYDNTAAEYFPSGEAMYASLLRELENAEKYIFLEYFIISSGEMWNSILGILIEKAVQGVDVRIIYDDMGCIFTLPFGYDKKLESLGIKCCVFSPVVPVISSKLNNRDHRKIAVIDGKTGYTGGINIADEYINKIEKYGHWKDTGIMLKGEAVWSLTVMFLSTWNYIKGINEDFNLFKAIENKGRFSGYVQPFEDSPLDNETVGETTYLNLINKAKTYVYITTPYLIIGNEMVTALTSAAKEGVDVRIITPHLADKWYVHEVTKSYYKILVESGVKIYEYTPGFIHSKTYVADDKYGIVGTINMDFRSLYLHFECGVWMYRSSCILDMKNDFLNTLELSEEITLEHFKNIKWYKSLKGSLLRVFAPLM